VADTYVVAVGFGTTLVGYYQVAFTIASVIGYSYWLAFALYPLLLRGGDQRLPSVSIGYSLLFGIPLATGGIVLAGPILGFPILGGKYLPATTGLQILSVMFIFTAISMILDQTLLGTERADVGERPKFLDLARSNLLFVPVVNILFGLTYVLSLYLTVSYATSSAFDDQSRVALWGTVELAATLVFLLVKARRARRFAKLLPGRGVAYYLVGAALMGLVLYFLSGAAASQDTGTLVYGLRLLGIGLLGLGVYGGSLYVMDTEFRNLARSFARKLGR